jgi:hypothetical protein
MLFGPLFRIRAAVMALRAVVYASSHNLNSERRGSGSRAFVILCDITAKWNATNNQGAIARHISRRAAAWGARSD